jgi:hypothetical protein
MKAKYFYKIGGISSITQSLLYVIAIAMLAFVPVEQITGNMDQFVKSYAVNPLPLIVMSLSFIILGLLGFIFVAPATIAMFPDKNKWLVLGKYIAQICLMATTLYFIWFLTVLPSIPLNALHAPLNWIGWFTFGGMGLFVAIVGIQVWISGVLSKGFVAICAIKTLGFWIILFGIIFSDFTVAKIGAVIGGLIGGVIYHTWLGIALLHKSNLIKA